MPEVICRGCGAGMHGRFCAACGQRLARDDDFHLSRMLSEAWEELSNTDSRLWRSITGIFRPGRLTRAWLDHRWQDHLPPLRLYLLLSAIYFLLAWDVTFQLSAEQVRQVPESQLPEAVRHVYGDAAASARLSDLTALMKFVSVVALGAWLALLHWGNRRPVGEHLVFAMHYAVLDYTLFSLQALVLVLLPDALRGTVFNATFPLVVGLMLAWTIVSVRRVYGRGWVSSLSRGLAVVAMDIVLSALSGQVAFVLTVLSLDLAGG